MMASFRYLGMALAAVGLGALALSGDGSLHDAHAQTAKSSAKRLTTTQAKKALAEGKTALKGGRSDQAVSSLEKAITSKRLSYRDLASALYHRGLANRARKQPAKAIEDLTAALWIKNGLTADERKGAIAARAATYEQAGLSNQGQSNPSAVPKVAAAPARPAQPAAARTATPARVATAQPARPSAPAPAPTASASSRSAPNASQGWATSTQLSAAPTPGTTAPTVDPLSDLGRNVSGFFSSLFSNSGAPSETTTASISRPSTGGQPTAASAWSSQTSVARAPTGQATSRTRTPVKPSTVRKGIRVQVAAMRREADAKNLASRINTRYAEGLRGTSASVSASQVGNMGKLYRVIVGPFRSSADSRTTCAQLQKDGLDCLVIR